MKCLRFLVFLPAFFYSGFAFAIPNVWTTGFGQGRLEYLISNKKITLSINCNIGDVPDSEHGLGLENSKGVNLFTQPNHTLSFLINGKAFEFGTNETGIVESSFRNAANEWRDFIEAIHKANKIEVYYDDEVIVEYNPKNINLEDMKDMTETCSPLFDREEFLEYTREQDELVKKELFGKSELFVGEWIHRDFPEFSVIIEKNGDKYKVTDLHTVPESTTKCVYTAVKTSDNKLKPVEKKAPCTIYKNNKAMKAEPSPLRYTTYVQKGDDTLYDHAFNNPECAGNEPSEDDEYCTTVFRRAK